MRATLAVYGRRPRVPARRSIRIPARGWSGWERGLRRVRLLGWCRRERFGAARHRFRAGRAGRPQRGGRAHPISPPLVLVAVPGGSAAEPPSAPEEELPVAG